MNRKQVKGITSQLLAYNYLLKQPNTIVFTPLDGVGPIDIVTYNTKTKEYKNYDVKTVSLRKHKTYRCKAGSRINRTPSKLQKDLNVEIIYVTERNFISPRQVKRSDTQ